jgi:hypothetical protein
MADILRPPLVSQRQNKRPIPRVEPFPNLLGTTLAAAPGGLNLPLRTGRLFESAPRRHRSRGEALASQGLIVYDGPEAAIASLTDSAPRRVRRLSLYQPLDLLGTTLVQTGLALPLLGIKLDGAAPRRRHRLSADVLYRPLTLAPSAYDVSIAESAAGADALTAALVAVGALSEAGSASDSDSAANTAVGSISEAASGTDSESASLVAVATITEAASGTDSVSSTTGNDSLLSEAASATDSVSSVVTAVGVLTESGSADELFSSIASLIGQLSEAGSAAEGLDGSIAGSTYNVSIAESGSSTDAITGALLAAASIAENASAGDAHSTLLQAAASLIESANASHAELSQMVGVASLTEVATAIDAMSTGGPPRGNRIIVITGLTRRIKLRPN